MKHTWKLVTVVLLVGLVASGCTHALHNGTEMLITKVKLVGLPSAPYSTGTKMVFDYCIDITADYWVHSAGNADFTNAKFIGTAAANGTMTFTFTTPLSIQTPQLKFLLINPGKDWGTMKIDKKHSGKSGGDVIIDNKWSGSTQLLTLTGTVSGDDVNWVLE